MRSSELNSLRSKATRNIKGLRQRRFFSVKKLANSLAFIYEGVTPRNVKTIPLSTSAIAPITASSSTILSSLSIFIPTFSSNQSATVTSSLATSSPPTTNLASKSSLSTSTSAGVGVGSAVGVLAIAALCFFCFHRHEVAITESGNGRSEPGPQTLQWRLHLVGLMLMGLTHPLFIRQG